MPPKKLPPPEPQMGPPLLLVPDQVVTGKGQAFRVIPEPGRYAPLMPDCPIHLEPLSKEAVDRALKEMNALMDKWATGQ